MPQEDQEEEEKKEDPISEKPRRKFNLMKLFKKILKEEGFTGLYKGLDKQMLGNLISFSVYFFWYKFC